MNRRSEQLRTVADDFLAVHDQWQDDDARPYPDEVYWDSADRLTASFESGDIPEDCRDLLDAVSAFSDAKQEFDDREDGSNNMPPTAFFDAVGRIRAARRQEAQQAQPLVPLEPMAELRAKGCDDLMIAKVYNLKDRYGNWMPQLVQKEIDKPGSILKTPGAVDGKDWIDRRLAKRQRDGNRPAEDASSAIKRKTEAKQRKKGSETPRDYWEQKLTVKQAALNLDMPEAEVAQIFAQFDEERGRGLEDGSVEDALAQTIRQKAASGMGPAAIAKDLDITLDDVAKVLGKPKKGRPAKPKAQEQPAA